MKSYTILLLCWIAVVVIDGASMTGIDDGTGGDGDGDGSDKDNKIAETNVIGEVGKGSSVSDLTGDGNGGSKNEKQAGMGPMTTGHDIDVKTSDNVTKPKATKPLFYNEAWLKTFSKKQLTNQAKWKLADKQPDDGTFQTRIYPMQWWSTSFIPCLTHDEAVTEGYLKLYFYFNGFNYQRQQYPLTYPVLLSVDKRSKPKAVSKNGPKLNKNNKKRRRRRRKPKACSTRYTSRFYLPLPLKKWAPKPQDKTIKSFKMNEVVYVREYSGNYTSAYCNEQAGILASDLSRNNISTWDTYWICAKYEAPEGQTEQRYEVWMKQRFEE